MTGTAQCRHKRLGKVNLPDHFLPALACAHEKIIESMRIPYDDPWVFENIIMQEKGLYAFWAITGACNFNCGYCITGGRPPAHSTLSPQAICRALKKMGPHWTIEMGGLGEPFLHPDFIGICKELAEKFKISITTNLSFSLKLREFADTISPDRVENIDISVHIKEREARNSVADFIKNVSLLQERKFNTHVIYVLHPTLIERFERDYEYFNLRGVQLKPKPFKGWYRGRLYPRAYSENEKELILNYDPLAEFYPFRFMGMACNAGRTFINIDMDGVVTRCPSDNIVLGDIGDGFKLNNNAESCGVYKCSCLGRTLIEDKSLFHKPLHQKGPQYSAALASPYSLLLFRVQAFYRKRLKNLFKTHPKPI